jgi:hypothetical protein
MGHAAELVSGVPNPRLTGQPCIIDLYILQFACLPHSGLKMQGKHHFFRH